MWPQFEDLFYIFLGRSVGNFVSFDPQIPFAENM
jgi:hypothetical protein